MYSLMDQTFSIRCMRLRDWELYRGIYLFPFTNVLRDCYNISTKKMLYISNKKVNKNIERERERIFFSFSKYNLYKFSRGKNLFFCIAIRDTG